MEGEAPHFYFFDTFFTDRMLLGDGYKYEKVQKWTNMKATLEITSPSGARNS